MNKLQNNERSIKVKFLPGDLVVFFDEDRVNYSRNFISGIVDSVTAERYGKEVKIKYYILFFDSTKERVFESNLVTYEEGCNILADIKELLFDCDKRKIKLMKSLFNDGKNKLKKFEERIKIATRHYLKMKEKKNENII